MNYATTTVRIENTGLNDWFRAFQPVIGPDSRLDSSPASPEAGANDLVTCSTTTGSQPLSDGRAVFGRFREATDEIVDLQSNLPEGRYSATRIRRLYR